MTVVCKVLELMVHMNELFEVVFHFLSTRIPITILNVSLVSSSF